MGRTAGAAGFLGTQTGQRLGVVFVTDRQGVDLRLRQRHLQRAGMFHTIVTQRRPYGAWYSLCVREEDVVAAQVLLEAEGCESPVSLTPAGGRGPFEALREVVASLWVEAVLSIGDVVAWAFGVPERLLTWAGGRGETSGLLPSVLGAGAPLGRSLARIREVLFR